MYSIDERLRGLPAVRDQVVQLHQSLNTPHLAIPSRKAGPAKAFVLGLRGPTGFAVFVYLYMPETGESAVYVPSNGTVSAEQFPSEESDALGFVESMGFIMDNLNFRGRSVDEQETLVRTLPVFMREPPPPDGTPSAATGVLRLGKLFSAFCLALLAQACVHVSDRDREQSTLHYELAVENLLKSPQLAMKEAEKSLALNPENADAWHIRALVLHHGFQRLEEAQVAYEKAIQLKADFSEAQVNLGTLYMDQKRYDDAIAQYKLALNDMMYRTPYIAQGNMGWAWFKKGDVKQAIELLKSALTINPKYCLAEMWLGQVYESQSNAQEACKYFGRFTEHCPERPDGWQREGICLAQAGQKDGASKAFDTCAEKAQTDDQKDLCKSLKGSLLR